MVTGPMRTGVVGPSGSGKSSLLRAGLVPRLRTATPAWPGGRPVALITPGASPVDALARGLASLAGPGFGGLPAERLAQGIREHPERYARLAGRGEEPPAIIVDQLEEIFTAGADGTGRQEFVAALAALAERTLIVTGLRADFYSHALSYPVLARSLQERQIVVGPMSADQLRRAIVAPAHKAGLDIDDGLVEVLLAEMRPYGAAGPGAGGHEAGALPLLSHALLATWEHSRGGRLTVSDYQASGGIRDAITRTAEHAYAALGAGEQDVARQLFLRLASGVSTCPGCLTRRRAAYPCCWPPSRDVVPEARRTAARLVVPEARSWAARGPGVPGQQSPAAGKPRRGVQPDGSGVPLPR